MAMPRHADPYGTLGAHSIGTLGPHGIGTLGPHSMGPYGPPTAGTLGPHSMGPYGPPTAGTLGPHSMGPYGPPTSGTFGPHSLGALGPTSAGSFGPHSMGPLGPPSFGPPPAPPSIADPYGGALRDPYGMSFGRAFESSYGSGSSLSYAYKGSFESPYGGSFGSSRYDGLPEEPHRGCYEDHYADRYRSSERPSERSYARESSRSAYDRDDYQYNPEYTSVTRITHGLYLTNKTGGLSEHTLQSLRIDYIICAAEPHEIERPHHPCNFKRIPVPKDPSGPNIIQYFDEVAEIIDSVDRRGGNVLIQSLNGVSRGPTLAIAYLIKHKRMRLSEAYRLVAGERKCIKPYFGFWRQLIRYEKEIFGHSSAAL